MRRRGFAVAAGALMVFAWLGAVGQPGVADAACPNEERRAEQGALALALPDCRAYELVSLGNPLVQETDPERDREAGSRAAADGNALTYFTIFPSEGALSSGKFYLSTRGSDGWTPRGVAPQNTAGALFNDSCAQNVYFSPDLTQNIDEEGYLIDDGVSFCPRNRDVLAPGESPLHRNVFLHDNATDSYRLLNVTPEGVEPGNAKFQDASEDFGRILFSVEARLTPESLPGYNLYVWADGHVRLLTFLPDGTPAVGELAEGAGHEPKEGPGRPPGNADRVSGSGLAPIAGAVSEDGSRVFFYVNSSLYMRENPEQPQSPISGGECIDPALACTTQIDVSHGPGASGGGNFWRATEDGSRVFFTAERKLTPDSTAVSGKADLYEYAIESGQLTDLTANVSEAADVRGISGISEDGSHLYFVANGAMAPGAAPGNCRGPEGAGQTCSLYVVHEGSIEFIATLARDDREAWQEGSAVSSIPRRKQSRVTANVSTNGRFFAFVSLRSLTGYDNRDISTGDPNRMLFLYDAATGGGEGELRCISCIPDGTRPDETVSVRDFELSEDYGPDTLGGKARWKESTVLDDGSVFFDTIDPLVSGDTNGRRDVYRYRDGRHELISPGIFPGDARFFDATPSGSSVFFRTPQSLVGNDTDMGNVSLYVARVGGGFPEPAPARPPCEGETCRGGIGASPGGRLPATSTFIGPSNPKGRNPKKRKTWKAKRCARVKRPNKASRCARSRHRQGAAKRQVRGKRRTGR